jgi:NCAIR mutase (PurE)-related protein
MYTIEKFKRGNTFELTCRVALAFGQTLTSTRCQLRLRGGLVEELTVTPQAPTLTEYIYKITATAAQTADWPVALLTADILYIVGAQVANTENFNVEVVRAQTV